MTESTYRVQGATGEWEVVIGLEVHAQITQSASPRPAAALPRARAVASPGIRILTQSEPAEQ